MPCDTSGGGRAGAVPPAARYCRPLPGSKFARWPMSDVKCRHKIASPEQCGAQTWAQVRELAARYPDVRPCLKHVGSRGCPQWVERKCCAKCKDAVREKA
jgi:hypothetical protein